MALIKCDECGRMISDKSAFCPGCGYPTNMQSALKEEKKEEEASQPSEPSEISENSELSENSEISENSELSEPAEVSEPPAADSGSRGRLLVFLGVFLILFGVVGLCYWMGSMSAEEGEEDADTIEAIDTVVASPVDTVAVQAVEPAAAPAAVQQPTERQEVKPARERAGDPALLDMKPGPERVDEPTPAPPAEPAPAESE